MALAGRKHDGHRFVAEAARNGALAALVAEGAPQCLDTGEVYPPEDAGMRQLSSSSA